MFPEELTSWPSLDLPHPMFFGLYITLGEDCYYYFEKSKLCSSVSILYTLLFGLLCLSDGTLFNISVIFLCQNFSQIYKLTCILIIITRKTLLEKIG